MDIRLNDYEYLQFYDRATQSIKKRIKEQLYTTFTGNELFCMVWNDGSHFMIPSAHFKPADCCTQSNLTITNEIKISFVGSQMIFTSHLWWSPSVLPSFMTRWNVDGAKCDTINFRLINNSPRTHSIHPTAPITFSTWKSLQFTSNWKRRIENAHKFAHRCDSESGWYAVGNGAWAIQFLARHS